MSLKFHQLIKKMTKRYKEILREFYTVENKTIKNIRVKKRKAKKVKSLEIYIVLRPVHNMPINSNNGTIPMQQVNYNQPLNNPYPQQMIPNQQFCNY